MTTRSELISIGLGADRGFERALSLCLSKNAEPELTLPRGQHPFYDSITEPPLT